MVHGRGQERSAVRDDWPFVGRHAELAMVTASTSPAPGDEEQRRHRGAVVVGPAGVGKTRLLHEVRRWAEGRGLPTATAIATRAASGTPYGAVAHLLGGRADPPPEAPAWTALLTEALRHDEGPTVLLLDDAHLLDPASAALLLRLVLEGTVSPVVAVRGAQSTPDPVTTLWKDGLLARVDLEPFSMDLMGQLIDTALGGQVSERTRERLAAVSGGTVRHAQELVAAALDAQALTQRDGVWVWDERVVLGPRLVDVVWSRLETLTEDERRALTLVALSDPLPVTVAETLVDPGVLCSLEAAGLVRVDPAGGRPALRMAHQLDGEVLLARAGRLGQRRLVATLADAFEADPRTAGSMAARVTAWRLEADQEVDPSALLHATVEANQSFDHELAARFARAALDASGEDPLFRTEVVVELARALLGCDRAEEAHELLVGIEGHGLAAPRPALVDAYLDTRFRASYVGLGRTAEMSALLDRVDARHGSDEEPRARRVAAYRASLAVGGGRPREALRLAEPVLAGPEPPDAHRLIALEAAGEALAHLGRPRAAARVWERVQRLAAADPGRFAAARRGALMQQVLLAQLDGRVGEALTVTEAVYATAAGSSDVAGRGLLALALGRGLVQAGRLERAHAVLLDAVSDLRRVDAGGSLAWAFVLLSQYASLVGRADAAREWRARAEELRDRWVARIALDVVTADAWLVVGRGDVLGARAVVRRGADLFPEMLLARAWLLHLACRLGDRGSEVVTELRSTAATVESDYPSLLADHAEACQHQDAGALEAVAERFALRGLDILAAEAATEAAHAHRAAGSTDGARRAAARATVLAQQLDDLSTPALDDRGLRVSLTRREEDVARLAAAGLSNALIAERLVLSVRTVESHLYRSFTKLGIASRAELTDVLPGRRPSSQARTVQ